MSYMLSFHYFPSASAAMAVSGLYAIVLCFAIWRHCKFSANRYMLIVPFMAIAELIGYSTRGIVAKSFSVGLYVNAQVSASARSRLGALLLISLRNKDIVLRYAHPVQLFLLLAPIALAVINYIVVGRLLRASGKVIGCLRPHHIARIFLASDIFVSVRPQTIMPQTIMVLCRASGCRRL
jgi:hypothetical protein